MNAFLFTYILHLADNALILGQRNAEWTGHGPALEQDIAITNISLDLIGQARNLYQYAAEVYERLSPGEQEAASPLLPRLWKTFNRELQEDDLAMLRDERQYRNLLLAELPKGDWAQTVLRQFFFSAYQHLLYTQLQLSTDAQLAAIAEKSVKETAYHLRWSSEWVIRLGYGTEESAVRLAKALEELWMYTGELFIPAPFEEDAVNRGYGVAVALLKEAWLQKVNTVFSEALLPLTTTLTTKSGWAQSGGKEGVHSEYLGYLLTEMQYLQRTFPNSTW